MVKGFWRKLKKPIFALAPMADVTDAAFRRIIAKYGKPDVTWTEFVSADGLCSAGRKPLLHNLWFSPAERPIVAQFFGANPKNFYQVAELSQELGFDGIDINMGCPEKNVQKQGAGAALCKNPKLAQKIIQEAKRGAGKLPVSVKIRVGYNKIELQGWLPYILEMEPAAVIIHFRTRKEMSLVPAHWELAEQAMEITRKYFSERNRPVIIGNGDLMSLSEGKEKIRKYGIDGVMFGRAIFGNPFLFSDSGELENNQKLKIMLEHTRLFEKMFGPAKAGQKWLKNFDVMKKHYQAYVSGFPGAKELRISLMTAKSAGDVGKILKAGAWLRQIRAKAVR